MISSQFMWVSMSQRIQLKTVVIGEGISAANKVFSLFKEQWQSAPRADSWGILRISQAAGLEEH